MANIGSPEITKPKEKNLSLRLYKKKKPAEFVCVTNSGRRDVLHQEIHVGQTNNAEEDPTEPFSMSSLHSSLPRSSPEDLYEHLQSPEGRNPNKENDASSQNLRLSTYDSFLPTMRSADSSQSRYSPRESAPKIARNTKKKCRTVVINSSDPNDSESEIVPTRKLNVQLEASPSRLRNNMRSIAKNVRTQESSRPSTSKKTPTETTSRIKTRSYVDRDRCESTSENDTLIEPSISAATLHTTTDIQEKINSNALLDGTFFKVCGRVCDTEHMKVICQTCPDRKVLAGSLLATTNLLKHLKRVHPDVHQKYLSYKKEKRSLKRQAKFMENENEPPTKRRKTKTQLEAQTNFEDRLLKFVIETISPLSIIEQPSFRELFKDFDISLVSRRTITRRIALMDKQRFKVTKQLLDKPDYVCTTADIWSAKSRSFIGVTCHFIDDDYSRQSFPLACRRFKGSHTYDCIAEILRDIHSQYGLDNSKIVATITDNARNFVKAFKEFGIRVNSTICRRSYEDREPLENVLNDSSDSDATNSDLSDIDSEEISRFLPEHLRCSSHTLNLVATSDYMTALKTNDRLYNRHLKVVAKCSKLWHKAALPKSAEIIVATVHHTFSYPTVTRWNSFYDSLTQILNSNSEIPLLFELLGLGESLTINEIAYMEAYCLVMKPIVRALDMLQGENRVYYGIVLPTLLTLKRHLQKLGESSSKCGRFLANACLTSINDRFSSILSFNDAANDAILASISHPAFKLNWFHTVKHAYKLKLPLAKMKEIFRRGLSILGKETTTKSPDEHNSGSISSFLKLTNDRVLENESGSRSSGDDELPMTVDVQAEMFSYLNDPRSKFVMLNNYPTVKKMFYRYNTPLTSSAPVERLFSFASITNTPKRHALSDSNFERLVLLKSFSKTNTKLEKC